MIVTEMLKNDTLIRHYSNSGMMLRQNETGVLYADAVDVYPCKFTYMETDIKIPTREDYESKTL